METESGSQRRYLLGRLVTHANGDMRLFIPFIFVGDSESDDSSGPDEVRVVLVNPLNQTYTVLRGVSGLESLLLGGDLQSKAGLPPASKAAIEALPEVEIGVADERDCAICLDGMKLAKVMPCKHRFHGGCVEKWLRIHGSCPVCRFQMPQEEEHAQRKGQRVDDEDGNNGTRRGGRREIWIPFSVTSVAVDQSSNQETGEQRTEDPQSSD